MTDPAVEAAQLAGGDVSSICHLVAVGAARAALKPVQALHWRRFDGVCAAGCFGGWPCATAKRIYPEEEL